MRESNTKSYVVASPVIYKIRHNGFCDSLSICLGNDDTNK